VEISDGKYSVVCFSQPFVGKINEVYTKDIICYDSEYLYIVDTDDYFVNRVGLSFYYILRGKIFNMVNYLTQLTNILQIYGSD